MCPYTAVGVTFLSPMKQSPSSRVQTQHLFVANVAWLRESRTSEWPGTLWCRFKFPSSSFCLHSAGVPDTSNQSGSQMQFPNQVSQFCFLASAFSYTSHFSANIFGGLYITVHHMWTRHQRTRKKKRHTSTILRMYSLW